MGSTSAKGQAAYDYKQKHPNADKAQFEAHYDDLSTAAKAAWKVKATEVKDAKEAKKALKEAARAAKAQAAHGP
ncbi:hypothetical protein C8R46DRAFT_1236140 [Mycena filopes]|nr:hypothetical protein C8R46DRAFT_1236140 [Mycena filopes]